MIIFYDRNTGKIQGTIGGRKHTQEHLDMWVGDKETTKRIIVEWEKNEGSGETEPKTSQGELFKSFEQGDEIPRDYLVKEDGTLKKVGDA